MVMRPAGVPFPNCQSWLQPFQHFCLPARIVHPPRPLLPPSWISVRCSSSLTQLGWVAPQPLSWEGQNSCSPALPPVVLVLATLMHQKYSLVHVHHMQKAELAQLVLTISLPLERKNIFPCGQLLYFLLAVSICVLARVSSPTHVDRPAPPADCGKPHLHLNSLHFSTLYF